MYNKFKKTGVICISVLCMISVIVGNIPALEQLGIVVRALAQTDAVIDYDYYTNADYALVDTENIFDKDAETLGRYRNSNVVEKENKITLNRIAQRHNPNRTTGSIVIEKTNANDAYIDFNSLNNHDMGYFPYYYYEGRVRALKLGQKIRPAFIRDTVTKSGTTLDINAFYITNDGGIYTVNKGTIKKVSANQWVDFKFVLDIENNIGRLYIDGTLVDDKVSLKGIKTPSTLRVWVDTDNTTTACSAEFDKLKLLGMRHDYDPENPDFHPSFFSDDTGIEAWLSEGNKTAFYGYSQNVFGKGKKHIKVDDPLYGSEYDNTLYVSAKALGIGYGFSLNVNTGSKTASDSKLTLTADSDVVTYNGKSYTLDTNCLWHNGTVYIPVVTFAKTVLGHTVKSDVNGLVITAANNFDLITEEEVADYLIQVASRSGYKGKVTPIKALNWYMSFERPDKSTIKKDFEATLGTNLSSAHPRLIGTKSDFDTIRQNWQTDSDLNKMVKDILQKADSHLDKGCPVYELPDKQRILNQARTTLEYFRNLGFAYQITGDKKYAAKVWELLQGLLCYPDWNPSHMIDTAELVGGCSIGFDWCYDYFSEEQKQFIYTNVKKLGLDPIHDSAHDIIATRYAWAGANDYVASKSNFNTVINGSQLMGLCAFAEFDKDFCYDAIVDALRSIEYTMLVYRPDGIWMESPSYWEYSASYVSRGLSTVINSTGNHYGLMDAQGVKRTARWFISQNTFIGINNFHDAAAGKYRPSALAFFGKVQNDPIVCSVAKDYAVTQRSANVEDAIWYIPGNNATPDDLPLDLHYEGFDTVGSRSSYTDRLGFFYATHGGQVTCYHSQYDVCTFVMDLMGVRWAYDLGSDDYNVRRDQNGFHKMYRDIAEGHNVMVFNQNVPGQMKDGCAEMTKWESTSAGSIAIYDVTSVYGDWVNSASRGFLVGDNRRSLTIRDEFNTKSNMPAHWFMCTPADVEIVNNNFAILTEDDKQLKFEVLTNVEDYKLTVGPAQPLPTSPDIEGQNPNEGYSRIAIELNTKGGTDYYVMVKLSPYGEKTNDINYSNMPSTKWTTDALGGIKSTLKSKTINFDNFANETAYSDSNYKIALRQDVNLYPEFSYQNKKGLFGKGSNDSAFALTMTPGLKHGDTAETTSMATFTEPQRVKAQNNEYYTLEMDFAISGSNAYKQIRVGHDGWKGNVAYLLQTTSTGALTSQYLGITSSVCSLSKEKWYKIKFVVKANNQGENITTVTNDGTVDTSMNQHDYWLYIDNNLVSSGKFYNNSRTDRTGVVTANHFTGFDNISFLNFTDAQKNTEYTSKNPASLYIDNLTISTGVDEYSHGINFDDMTSVTTDEFKKEIKNKKGTWKGAVNTSNYYDMYTEKNSLGKIGNDVSFVSVVNNDSIDYNRIEFVENGYSASIRDEVDIKAPRLNYGEFYELEFYMAYTGTGTSYGVQGFFVNNSGNDGKQRGYTAAILKEKGNLTAFGTNYPDILFEQGKWYKFNVVIHAGNDNATDDNYKNWYKIYINDKLRVDKTVFNVKNQRSSVDTDTKFMGFHKFWIGTVNDGTYNGNVYDKGYFDDITVSYHKKEPVYNAVELATNNPYAKLYMKSDTTLETYIDERCSDISEFYTTDPKAKIEYPDKKVAQGDSTVIIRTANNDRIFAKLKYQTDVARKIPFGSAYAKEVIVGEKDFTKASYVPGAFGKASDDYAIKMTTTNIWDNYYVEGTDGNNSANWVEKDYDASGKKLITRDSMNPLVSVSTEGAGRNVPVDTRKPYSISLSLFTSGDYDAANVQFIPSSDKGRPNIICFNKDGYVYVRTMEQDGSWAGKYIYQKITEYNNDEWQRVQLNVYPASNTIEIILNGKLLATQQLFAKADVDTGNGYLSRFKVEQNYTPGTKKADAKSGFFIVDDIDVTNGSAPYAPSFDIDLVSDNGFVSGVSAGIIASNDVIKLSDISDVLYNTSGKQTTYRVFEDNTYSKQKDSFSTGDIVVAESNKIYKTYTVVNNKDSGFGEITGLTLGQNQVSVEIENIGKCKVTVAGYDKAGELKSVAFGESNGDYKFTSGRLTQTATVMFDMASDVEQVRVYVSDYTLPLKPAAKSKIAK